MRSNIIRRSHSNFLPITVLLAGGILLAGCVTPIPMAQEAPDLNYKVTRPAVVAVVDERDVLAEGKPPTKDEAISLLAARSAQRLLVLSLTKQYVSINLNWVTAFNFDWGYRLEIQDQQGNAVANVLDSERDVVDMKADDSAQNQVKMAYRERLIKILECPEVRAALEQ